MSVANRAADRPQSEYRDLRSETDHSQQSRRTRQAIDKPAQRDLLHPSAADRDELTGEIQPVIAMAQ